MPQAYYSMQGIELCFIKTTLGAENKDNIGNEYYFKPGLFET